MKPSEKYAELVLQPGFVADAAQRNSVALLDRLYAELVALRSPPWWQRPFLQRLKRPVVTGLYLWGGVGRGKTLLMDLFHQSLPETITSERIHFHSFMNRVHGSLRSYGEISDPLRRAATEIAERTRVLCLDEFVIIDIGDAMIMAGLLEALFEHGVVLVTTSNAAPDQLYRDGLQRARFIPAIKLIETHCQVANLDGDQDYRLRYLQQTDLYSVPHDEATVAAIRSYLAQHISPVQAELARLEINGRVLAKQFCAEDTVWFTFAELCETARSQNDYLELARFFNTLILTDIPQMVAADDDVARRFVLLIDILYDHRVKLICSAAVMPDQLYLGQRLAFEFERTASRLIEMQSESYLARGHNPQ